MGYLLHLPDNHIDFVHYMLLVAVTEGEKLINILFHFCSSNQHEVEYKNQNKQIDGKTADAAHQKLADAGEYGCYRAYVFFCLVEVIFCLPANPVGKVGNCVDKSGGVYIDGL